MTTVKLLDCTLRDGGYINNWNFRTEQIEHTVLHLTDAGIDYVELGYVTSVLGAVDGTRFGSVESASAFIPEQRGDAKYVVMADVAQFDVDSLTPRSASTVDGIRVVFYKRQIEEAFAFCEKVAAKGYDVFLQPMVTVDYSPEEFEALVMRFGRAYDLYAVSVVDSFGCMSPSELGAFVDLLDQHLEPGTRIGFHGHENMRMSLTNVGSLFARDSAREFVIDSSVGGLGRGAGNLCTELVVNELIASGATRYSIAPIVEIISEMTEPLSRQYVWGYSPYFLLTAMRKAHPNFATYLLEKHNVSISAFKKYLDLIPDEMLTRCTKPYVEQLYLENQPVIEA